ncbi:YajQ family cyclic di-GMP-binding protein [Roseateles sp. So40a]|uniref:YajQ family cyclic di-GMP-binding protein n=1 Tax=Roseateles sp. So40a TaxID=3400226 RepID=UPI003A8512D6
MPSFDTVLEPDMVKVRNSVDASAKEIATRFDFKGTSAAIEWKDKEKEVHATGDAEFQLEQIEAVLYSKLTKQGVVLGFVDKQDKIEKLGGDRVKQVYKIKNGLESAEAKKVVGAIKESKLKVQAQIEGDIVRITGKSLDDLQAAQGALRKALPDLPLSFDNYRK